MAAHLQSVTVRFRDIDALGHVNNAAYLTFAETARVQAFVDAGMAVGDGRVPFIVAHASVDFRKPIGLTDAVEVRMWTSRIGGKSWDFDYELRSPEGAVYATVKTVQVAYDYELGRSETLAGELRDLVLSLRE